LCDESELVIWFIYRRALNTTPSGSTAKVLVHQRYSWRRDSFAIECNATMISTEGLISTGTGNLVCFTGGSCGSFATVSADVHCTDFSASALDYSSGERYDTFTLPLGGTFVVGFFSGAWLGLAIGGGGNWQVTSKIQLTVRPDGYINTSPVTSTLPVIYRTINEQHVHVIQMADADTTDTLRCRWATKTQYLMLTTGMNVALCVLRVYPRTHCIQTTVPLSILLQLSIIMLLLYKSRTIITQRQQLQ
jgi:hypothetical protein